LEMDGFCCKVSNSDAEAKSQLSCEMIGFSRMDGIRFCSENKKCWFREWPSSILWTDGRSAQNRKLNDVSGGFRRLGLELITFF
jgi:hypothetical protein